jgi:hypothetical protein
MSDCKKSMVSSTLADGHQRDRGSGARARERSRATVEEIDDRRVPQDQRIVASRSITRARASLLSRR